MFGTTSFSFFNFWKHPKYKPAKKQKLEEKKKERRLTELRKHIQVSLGYGDGTFKNKPIREMTEVVIDVERLRKGCFFSTDNKMYSDIARCEDSTLRVRVNSCCFSWWQPKKSCSE